MTALRAEKARAGRREASLIHIDYALEAAIKLLGNVSIAAITPADAHALAATLARGLSPNTARRRLNLISQAVALYNRQHPGAAIVNPFAGVRIAGVDTREARVMTDDEWARFWAALTGAQGWRIAFAMMRYCGLRPEEVKRQRWEWIDLAAQTMGIAGKGGREAVMWIPPAVARELERVPAGRRRGPVCRMTNWRRKFNAVCERAGIERIAQGRLNLVMHSLRHAAGTEIMRATGNLELTRKFLRHRRVETTVRYMHLADDDVKTAMKNIYDNKSQEE